MKANLSQKEPEILDFWIKLIQIRKFWKILLEKRLSFFMMHLPWNGDLIWGTPSIDA